MPIKPENKPLYGRDWKRLSRQIRQEANWRCEACGRKHRQRFRFLGGYVILAVAHIDQNPSNNARSNLMALCQRCHLEFDRPFNQVKAHETRGCKKDAQRPLLQYAN